MNYYGMIRFEWDDAKSHACFVERGFDFAYVLQAFFDSDRLVLKDTRWDYGKDRFQLLSSIDQRVFMVVYTQRDVGIRIVSARKANRREVKRYESYSCRSLAAPSGLIPKG